MKKIFILWLIFSGILFVDAQPSSKSINNALQKYVDSGDIPGVVAMVANTEKILSMDCVGYQNIAGNKKMNPDALFWIASQSKPITGAAVIMLVDEGKINLDEPVTTYLPELKNLMISRIKRDGWSVEERISKPLTLRHLLSHTSGMQWVACVQQQMGKIDVLPFDLSLYVSAMTPLVGEPGEQYLYSNQGINIAATIIKRVSRMSFSDFLQKRLFDPLGMKSATFWPTEKQLEKLAVPYKMNANGKLEESTINQLQYPLNDKKKRFAEAAGGLFCTPEDLVKFYQMIANKGVYKGQRYLSEASVIELGKKQTGDHVKESYGLGWSVSESYIGHGGAYGTDTRIYKDNGLIVMYFIQQEGLPKHGEAIQAFRDEVSKLYQL